MDRKLATAALILGSTAVSLLLVEFALRLAVNPGDFLQIEPVPDPVLGHRIEPLQGGHDALGFRNASVPTRADIVALGDSQTYGVGAPRDGSWPQQLGVLTGRSVYSMALGGYSPPDYLYLAQQVAPRLRPHQLIVGVYLGNDLLEACWAVQKRAYWARWRSSEAGDMCEDGDERDIPEAPKRFGAARDWLSRHSVVYGVLKAALLSTAGKHEQRRAAAPGSPDQHFPWVDPAQPTVRTVFTPQARLMAMDVRRRGVREGLRIAKLVLTEVATLARRNDESLLVVLIPTKERVYCEHLRRAGISLPSAFGALCSAEDRIKSDLLQQLSASDIAHVDVLVPLQLEVSRHVVLYPTDSDGHPRASGYSVIARAVAAALPASGARRSSIASP